ncbi:1,4-dihydroxy-2-naphthoate polyprenyltransferase [Handroanthus impetiginosus]|uniref:1,4-dihydroxy-2-naphthoate polyprenyltransferase n=1 Tax=Handroanthus impetiginosus TaxID=429701 RepID=A0A2G9GYB7_9LAMI|nr:1,4-dihydroxy-2-naphthoate polyprenyltransferase [Handroanthus impetiginosus]
MAASILSNVGNGYGIKKISREYTVKGHHVERKHSISLSTPHAEQRRFRNNNWTQRCHDKTFTSILSSKKENRHLGNLLKCRAATDYAIDEKIVAPNEEKALKEEEEIPRSTLIWRAAKLPMYTVSVIPVAVGTAAAYWQTGVFSLGRFLANLACNCLVLAWVNLSNDVYDYDTGADVNKKESVVNLFGGRTLINIIAWQILVVGFAGLSWLAVTAGSLRALSYLAFATFGFYLYQCPPFRLSYYGVGEPLLFFAFGPLSTIPFYLLSSKAASNLPISSTVVWSSVLIGLITSIILFCSHFHQIEDDKAVGKMSPLVRLGTKTGSEVVKWSVIGLYSILLTMGITQALPLASVILCSLTLPMANLVVDFVQKNHQDKTKIFMSKYYCVRLHTIFGTALAAGLVLARMFSGQPQAIPV